MISPSPARLLPDDGSAHDRTTVMLHWIVALIIAISYGLGLLREAMPRGLSRDMVLMLHTSFGLTGLALAAFRLGWRLSRSPSRQVPGANPAARLAHLALYAGMFAVPLVGLVMLWAKGRGASIFGLVMLPSPLAANRALARVLEGGHEIAAHGLMALAGLHALAALFHHYVMRDRVLVRMLPRMGFRQTG